MASSEGRVGAAGERFGKYTCLGRLLDRPSPTLAKKYAQIRLRCDCGTEVDALLTHWRGRPPGACAKCTRKRNNFGFAGSRR